MRCAVSQLYFGKELYMFRTDLLSIIRSLNTAYITIRIFHASYVDCLLARSGWTSLAEVNITSMKNTYCCVYSVETPDLDSRYVRNMYSSL
jgi:hypothetical protein